MRFLFDANGCPFQGSLTGKKVSGVAAPSSRALLTGRRSCFLGVLRQGFRSEFCFADSALSSVFEPTLKRCLRRRIAVVARFSSRQSNCSVYRQAPIWELVNNDLGIFDAESSQ